MGFLPRQRRDSGGSFVEYLLDGLAPLGPVSARAMFGGFGLFCDDRMFALVAAGELYIKGDAITKPSYQAAGMKPFRPPSMQIVMSYYRVPARAVDNSGELRQWARRGLDAAHRASR